MSFTSLTLGSNWKRGEWPTCVSVSHEGVGDELRYVPELTCRMETYGAGPHRAQCTECGQCITDDGTFPIDFCPNCGAMVVGE